MKLDENQAGSGFIQVPAPTGWPLVAAFGFTLVFAGLVTHAMVSILGGVAFVAGLVGWFRRVLPVEARIAVPIEKAEGVLTTPSPRVHHLQIGELDHRARLPLQVYPYSAGVRGGLVGGGAMAILAILYGIIGHRSVWYPINLLAATGSASIAGMSYEQLRQFSAFGLALATGIHITGSALVGLLYGVTLPMFPRRPMLLGGILAPLFWSGLLYSSMGIINPALQARVDWKWFIASQFAFGLVAGWVVSRHEKVGTMQFLPFAVRVGAESPDIPGDRNGPRANS